MKYLQKLIILFSVVYLAILSGGCQNNAKVSDDDTGTHESEISRDAQIDAPDSDNNDNKEKVTISEKEAENILREYLISANILKPDYVLEPLDPVLGEFKNEELFRFEMRHKEDADGDMGGKMSLHQISNKVYGYICDKRIGGEENET